MRMRKTVIGGGVVICRHSRIDVLKRIMAAPLGSPIQPLLSRGKLKVDRHGGVQIMDDTGAVRVRMGVF